MLLVQILLTALGAFFGAALSILASFAIEYQKKPKLQLTIESPPLDRLHQNAPVSRSIFVRVYVTNKPMPKLFSWLGRSAAYQCTGDIQFHHPDDGAPLFSRAMPVRWAGSDEPFSYQALPGAAVAQVFDPAKYNAAFRRDCFPGTPELVDVAARFDNDDDCYGWSNESYLPQKGWRNPEFKLPKGRYLVKVTIRSSGEQICGVFKLENSVAREHFRLLPASEEEAAKLQVPIGKSLKNAEDTKAKYKKAKRTLTAILLILPFLYIGFIIADRYGVWDDVTGLSWSERSEGRFEKSYAADASVPMRPGDKAWKPTLELFYSYSSATFRTSREPKVIARMQASLSTRTPPEGPMLTEWTSPSTPVVLMYVDWPTNTGKNIGPEDWVVVGTIGEWRAWVSRAKDRRRFLVQDIFLGTFGPLLSVFIFLLERRLDT